MPGVHASTTTSAQAIIRRAMSTPSAVLRSMSMLSLDVLNVPKKWAMSTSTTLSLNGGLARSPSIRELDSIRTTVAP